MSGAVGGTLEAAAGTGLDPLILQSFERLLATSGTPAAVRGIEGGGSADALWSALEESGFPDLLVPEEQGGAGLSVLQAAPLIEACGRHVLPVPLACTMAVRAALAEAGHEAMPPGPVTVAPTAPVAVDGGLACAGVPFGVLARWVVVATGPAAAALWPTAAARVEPDGAIGGLDAGLSWAGVPDGAIALPEADWHAVAAGLAVPVMAGIMERLLEMTLEQANGRRQFGRAIGKFQAIQQQVSVLAERTFAARMAGRIGCPATGWRPDRAAVATAKSFAGEAAAEAAAIAHAVHGAIGITADFDLQLFTRRLHALRAAYGTESWWNGELGREWLASGDGALDFIRSRLSRPPG